MENIPLILIIAGVAVLVIWAILMAIGSAVANAGKAKKVKAPKADHPPAPHAPAAHAPAKDHGGHGHDDKEKKAGPLTWAIAILLLVGGLLWLANWDRNNRDRMMAHRYLSFASASAVPSDRPAPPPPNAIDCKDEDLAAALIEPGEEVVVQTVPGTVFWASPNTSLGTITMCDYFRRSLCSSSTERRTIATSAFLVKNVSDQPVSFYCEHRQPS
ncbi:MAG TPA: hypothetical protein VNU25_00540 [Candidatus Paceibacterota bacterium]|nr:hypothetical protein [Candidatus Paceibacterota bacterium]